MATARVPLLDLTGHLPESYAPPSVAIDAQTATTKAGEALSSANAAAQSETNAGQAKTDAESARDLALGYRNAASGHADTATTGAQTATTKAGEALTSANNATATLAGAAVKADLGLAFGLDDVTETTSPTITVIGSIEGVAYGVKSDTTTGVHRSTDDGATWQQVSTVRAYGIYAAGDGEVIVNQTSALYKSSGWAADPTTATFAMVCDSNATSTFIQCSIDTYDNLVIAVEYGTTSYADSRNVWLSTDHGATFTSVLDLNILYPENTTQTHWHATCIDPWHTGTSPRLWVSHGDTVRGVYYSDNLGATWTLYANDWQPMPLIATPNGIVASTDQYSPDGIWLIPRTLGAKKLLHTIREPFWNGALVGFGIAAARDPRDPSRVVILFRADQQAAFTAGVPARIFVSDGYRASEVYQTANMGTVGTTQSTSWQGPPAITSAGKLLATYTATAGRWTVAGRLKSVSPTRQVADSGNVLTGTATGRSDIAIGSRAVSARQSVVIGSSAGTAFTPATDSGGVAVGEEASIRNLAVAVGYKSAATSHGVAAGQSANAGDDGVSIGSASAAVASSTAVGRSASATGSNAIAVGKSANASAAGAVATGLRAVASHTYAVAIGTDAVSSRDGQVTFGAKHLEMLEVSAPPAPAADRARVFIRDNGAGKSQLCVIFATGAVQVIATEP